MNKQQKQNSETLCKQIKQLEKKLKVNFKLPLWHHSLYQERLMRFGTEFKAMGLECPYDKRTENAIHDSFRTDILKLYAEGKSYDMFLDKSSAVN